MLCCLNDTCGRSSKVYIIATAPHVMGAGSANSVVVRLSGELLCGETNSK